jgi:transcriptional regulator with XRE-family HTH domain
VSGLQQLRVSGGWSQEGLSEAAGVSRRTILRIEHGNAPRLRTLIRLADALGVPLEALIPRSGMTVRDQGPVLVPRDVPRDRR